MLYLFCLFLAGCGVPAFLNIPLGSQLKQVVVNSSVKPAQYLVVCDIVAIFDRALADQFSKMTSQEYFKQIGNLSRINKNHICVWRFEQMPHQPASVKQLAWTRPRCSAYKVILFADYRGDGQHNIVLPSAIEQVRITLGEQQVDALVQDKKVTLPPTSILHPTPTPESMNFGA